MPIRLTPKQEERIQAIVDTGAYRSAEEALNAAVTAVELAAAPRFQGTDQELERLLLDGLSSKDLAEEEFWDSVDGETNAMLAPPKGGPRV
jgi:Arc/MetJ-type ribon-helix-helix transcriptional regulator